MLSQTKENVQDILAKLQVLDFMFQTSGQTHVEKKEDVETLLKKVTTKKLILLEELFRLVD
jgi:hypothetical protein